VSKHISKILLAIVITGVIGLIVVSNRATIEGRLIAPNVPPGSSRLAKLLGAGSESGYAKVLQPRAFSFPEDHGPHPEFRNEWWYVTGNLDGAAGERFGFELTIFRFRLAPASDTSRDNDSAWKTDQVFIGHFAISDVATDQFHVAQRYSRGAVGLAGAQENPFRVWIDDWSIEATQEQQRQPADDYSPWELHASDADIALDLQLTPLKKPVLNGRNGLSQKSAQPGNASYYYSISRLAADGTLRIGSRTYEVDGLSWLDREWGSSALSKEQQGWDWFALQLADGSDFMFYNLRRRDGTLDKHSAGTWIDTSGKSTHLGHDEVTIEVRDYWENAEGGRYPAEWTISVPKLGLSLAVEPVLRHQELITTVRYWEGAVDVRGMSGGESLHGRGYVELTGYVDN
jgi:predicted secreted hydrolase